MGNQPSVHDSTTTNTTTQQQQQQSLRPPLRNLFRHSNALGLTKSELDEFCKPSGLYPSCQWEEKAIRRLIGDGKLAARLRGADHRRSETDRECPICFLNYASLNVTKCCQANICTECYLQVRPQKEKTSACPFCNTAKLQVAIAKPLDEVAIKQRQEEEQRVIEARIRQRAPTLDDGTNVTTLTNDASRNSDMEQAPSPLPEDFHPSSSTTTTTTISNSGFGSSLEQNEHVARLRARTSSLASSQEGSEEDIALLAMTPEERRELEAEMRAQHFHPVAQRIEQEEAERRLRNQREYYQTQAGRLRELRARREMLYNRLSRGNATTTAAAAASGGTSGSGSSSHRLHHHHRTDPIPEEESLPRARTGRDWNRIVDAFESQGAGTINSLDDLVVLEAAIMLSMEEEARRREQAGESGNSDVSTADNDLSPTAASGESMASLMQNLRQRSLRSRQGGRLFSGMLGLTEEEQIAMAIAASLQDQASSSSSTEQSAAEAPIAPAEETHDEDDDDATAAAATITTTMAEQPTNVATPSSPESPPSEEAAEETIEEYHDTSC